jgi:hypothetical protein
VTWSAACRSANPSKRRSPRGKQEFSYSVARRRLRWGGCSGD